MKSQIFALVLVLMGAVLPASAMAYVVAESTNGNYYCYPSDGNGNAVANSSPVDPQYCDQDQQPAPIVQARRGGIRIQIPNVPIQIDIPVGQQGGRGGHGGYGHGGYGRGVSWEYQCAANNVFGTYAEGGGCNAFGCYYPGGGCNAFGCYYQGGQCNAFGCIKGHAKTSQACN